MLIAQKMKHFNTNKIIKIENKFSQVIFNIKLLNF